jgi:GxxExxY protein
MNENAIGGIIVDGAVYLHRNLGPGLLETVCEVTLARELERRGLSVERQVAVAIEFEGEKFDVGFCADLIVEGKVIIELNR